MRPAPICSALLALGLGASAALHLPVKRSLSNSNSKRITSSKNAFQVHATAGLADTGDPQVTNVQDLLYSAEVTINGISTLRFNRPRKTDTDQMVQIFQSN